MSEKYHPITINFSETALRKLDALKDRAKCKNRAEVVKRGLSLLQWHLQKKESGFDILLQRSAELFAVDFSSILSD